MATLMLAWGLGTALPAAAEPRFAQMYKQHAGYMPSCAACHQDGGGSDLNAYGEAFKDAGNSMRSFAALAEGDADGDGFSNAAEVAAKAHPGDAASTPKTPGDWLSMAALIPREVQRVFPDIRQYKPLDAILTDAEKARAAELGLILSSSDDTTIYIPVAEGRAQGTAIIVPTQFEEQTLFVLLATDRQLKVTAAQAIHTQGRDALKNSPAYAQVVGLAVEDLPRPEGNSLDEALARGLYKAATILRLRLKS
jgi:hypothetical protein